MRKLLVLVLILVLLLGAGDVAARIAIQHQLEQRINSYLPGTAAKVTIHSFPFLPRLALSGRVEKITAHAQHVSQGQFVLDRVDVTVTGGRIHRSRLLNDRILEIVAIDTGTVTADMTQADFERLVGLPVTLGAGTAQVTAGGASFNGRVSISNGRLQLQSPGQSASIPIPPLPVLPCLADVKIVPGHLIASCTFHQIPTALKIALQ